MRERQRLIVAGADWLLLSVIRVRKRGVFRPDDVEDQLRRAATADGMGDFAAEPAVDGGEFGEDDVDGRRVVLIQDADGDQQPR